MINWLKKSVLEMVSNNNDTMARWMSNILKKVILLSLLSIDKAN